MLLDPSFLIMCWGYGWIHIAILINIYFHRFISWYGKITYKIIQLVFRHSQDVARQKARQTFIHMNLTTRLLQCSPHSSFADFTDIRCKRARNKNINHVCTCVRFCSLVLSVNPCPLLSVSLSPFYCSLCTCTYVYYTSFSFFMEITGLFDIWQNNWRIVNNT